eukprot:NODE_169_length_16247_cov_0.185348.p1 type:complete len:694 gc:universal NODE_169_length_16247_cov_0.185348:10004-7923(-)
MLKYLSILIIWFGAYIYSTGFFKYDTHTGNSVHLPTKNPSKFVFILIDALRSDFDLNLTMPHTTYYTTAHAPTVTLPRLKSLLYGNVPSFIESWQYGNDNQFGPNWLSEYLVSKKGLFYGDSTWSRLIPTNLWYDYDYVSSFHASDTVECDLNVTRNVYKSINTDYDIMVLHYLGLDHIGHCCNGPSSNLFKPKLAEYSQVIHDIYNTLAVDDFMVILGDHGMTNQGQHGGSTLNETSTKAIFIHNNLETTNNILQIDLVPIFAHLTSGYLSSLNLGTSPPDFVTQSVNMLVNEQLMNKTSINSTRSNKQIQSELLARSADSDLMTLRDGMVYMTLGLFPSFVELILDMSVFDISGNKPSMHFSPLKDPWSAFLLALYMLVLNLTLFSSSFIEEEHMMQYFVASSILFANYLSKKQDLKITTFISSIGNPDLLFFCVIKFLRYYNQTGDKWKEQWDYSTFLINNPNILLVILCAALLYQRKWSSTLILVVKALQLNIVTSEHQQYIELSVLLFGLLIRDEVFIILLFTKPVNVPLVVMIVGMVRYYNHKNAYKSQLSTALLFYCLHKCVYFLLGNSNKLSSIDISNAFIGLSDMHIPLSPMYTFITTFGLSLWVLVQYKGNHLFYIMTFAGSWPLYTMGLCTLFMRHHLFIWSVFTPRLVYEYGWQIVNLIYYGYSVILNSSYYQRGGSRNSK